MEEIAGILISVGSFVAIFAIVYVCRTSKTKERLALLEKGVTAEVFNRNLIRTNYGLIKWGIFLIAIGLGVIAGSLLAYSIDDVVAYFTGILIMGGIGLLIAYWVTANIIKKNKEK